MKRGRLRPYLMALAAILGACAPGCKTVAPVAPPVVAPPPPRPIVPLDRRVAWILRLEQQRVLRDAAVPAVATPSARALESAITPDLAALSRDDDARVRGRAVLAIGRVASPAGVPIAAEALADSEEYVREQAAFALGLMGAPAGVDPLLAALKDPSGRVRARAIDSLGLIGDARAAAAVAAAAAGCGARLAPIEPDDEAGPKSPEIEICRLSLFTLVRLKQYDALARVALDAQGQPVSAWWPVAYALQRIGDPRAAPPLRTIAAGPGVYGPAFALRGLAEIGDRSAAPLATRIATTATLDPRLRIAAVRALARIGGADAVMPLLTLAAGASVPRNIALEAVTALGTIADARAFDTLIDLWTDRWPAMRAAAFGAAAKANPEAFLLVISSLDRDKDWSVRAALAGVLAALPADRVRGALQELADDADVRVRGPALDALARVDASDIGKRIFDALDAPDFAVRATAARLVGERKPVGGVPRLVAAYRRGESDATYDARVAALEALAAFGGDDAIAALRLGLADREWPVRLKAAELLRAAGIADAVPVTPAPLSVAEDVFESAALLHPAYTPHAFLETARGTIEIELDVVRAPMTVRSFVDLARAGFFNGMRVHRLVPNFVIQTGDPRGDGEGGPGYSIRDELSELPYVRGTVGMALAGRDTGGSQFFITLSPQPHLDGRYTVFGRVVHGIELLDQVQQWDTIDRVLIWDGVVLR